VETIPTANAALALAGDLVPWRLGFGILAEAAAQVAALEEDYAAQPRTVVLTPATHLDDEWGIE
jgi:hypothetical protein